MPPLSMPALMGFAVLMRQNNDTYKFHRPEAADHPNVMTVGSWALCLEQSTKPAGSALQFGAYDQCHPAARCVGCFPFCRSEDHLVNLSIRAGGRPVLWIEATDPAATNGLVSIQTFVPGRPHLSGVWVPALCPSTGQMVLVCTKRSIVARLHPCGKLSMTDAAIPGNVVAISVQAFCRAWASLTTTLSSPLTTVPAHVLEGAR